MVGRAARAAVPVTCPFPLNLSLIFKIIYNIYIIYIYNIYNIYNILIMIIIIK